MCNINREKALTKGNIKNELSMVLPHSVRVEKLVNEVETDWQVMKRFWAEWSVKKVMLTEFCDI